MRFYCATDVGQKRQINQDSVFATGEAVGNLPNLYIVADGMGGHNAGDFASRFAINSITEYIRESGETNPVRILQDAIHSANAGIIAEAAAHDELAGMGTTLVAATVIDEYAYIANIGDSRLYIMDDGLKQITRDHSLVEEMVRLGEISEEDAKHHPDKNIITRALGTVPDLEIDFFDIRLDAGAILLLCSDGLSNMVEDDEIESILRKQGSPEELTGALIEAANRNGGKDNIAVIIVEPDAEEE